MRRERKQVYFCVQKNKYLWLSDARECSMNSTIVKLVSAQTFRSVLMLVVSHATAGIFSAVTPLLIQDIGLVPLDLRPASERQELAHKSSGAFGFFPEIEIAVAQLEFRLLVASVQAWLPRFFRLLSFTPIFFWCQTRCMSELLNLQDVGSSCRTVASRIVSSTESWVGIGGDFYCGGSGQCGWSVRSHGEALLLWNRSWTLRVRKMCNR